MKHALLPRSSTLFQGKYKKYLSMLSPGPHQVLRSRKMEELPMALGDLPTQEEDCLPKVPLVININRKEIYDMAAHRLGLQLQNERIIQMDKDDYIAAVTVASIPTRKALEKQQKTFYGNFSVTEHAAVESAYTSVLAFLEKDGFIIVDDYSQQVLSKTKHDLFAAESWAMLFQSKTSALQKTINQAAESYMKMTSAIRCICNDHRDVLPIQTSSILPAEGMHHQHRLVYMGPASSSAPLDKLAQSLVHLHDTLVPLADIQQINKVI